MLEVRFYDFHTKEEDSQLKFAVIIARYADKWIFCKHRLRNTWEFPGGHREPGEDIMDTAKRELYEETGVETYTIEQIGAYSVLRYDGTQPLGEESFGMLFAAEVTSLGELPGFEIEKVSLFEDLPQDWTYPEIQPVLLEKYRLFIQKKK